MYKFAKKYNIYCKKGLQITRYMVKYNRRNFGFCSSLRENFAVGGAFLESG